MDRIKEGALHIEEGIKLHDVATLGAHKLLREVKAYCSANPYSH